jgi:hypothetical protein
MRAYVADAKQPCEQHVRPAGWRIGGAFMILLSAAFLVWGHPENYVFRYAGGIVVPAAAIAWFGVGVGAVMFLFAEPLAAAQEQRRGRR